MRRKKRKAREAFPGGTASDSSNFDTALSEDTVRSLRQLNRIRKGAYCGILITFAAFASVNGFRHRLLQPAYSPRHSLFVAHLVLFVTLVGLSIRWIIATSRELRLWLDWLKNPVQKRQTYVAIVTLSFALGICLAYTYNTGAVTLIFTIYLLVNYWGQWLSNQHFELALTATKKQLDRDPQKPKIECHRAVLNILDHYWQKRPQLGRITTMMFCSAIAFSFALPDWIRPGPPRLWLQMMALVILIADIILGELLIVRWRRSRNTDIIRALAGQTPKLFKGITPKLASKDDVADIKGYANSARGQIWAAALGFVGLIAAVDTYNGFKPPLLISPLTGGYQTWTCIGSGILALTFFALSYFWIWATEHELQLWLDWLKNPITGQQAKLAINSLFLALGAMIALALASTILFISGFITIYLLINYWTQKLSNQHFMAALSRTREGSVKPKFARVHIVLEQYWVNRPQLARITTLLFCSAMAYSIAFSGVMNGGIQKESLYVISYCVLFCDLLVGEIVILRWRRKRDADLLQAELGEA